MPQYLLSIYQPQGELPPPELLEKVMADLKIVNQELKAAGAWVFAGGLHPLHNAAVAHLVDGRVQITDGPFAETKEYLGGITIITAADFDAALEWAGKLARVITLPIEVRPFQGQG
jgi:hypothetical protein